MTKAGKYFLLGFLIPFFVVAQTFDSLKTKTEEVVGDLVNQKETLEKAIEEGREFISWAKEIASKITEIRNSGREYFESKIGKKPEETFTETANFIKGASETVFKIFLDFWNDLKQNLTSKEKYYINAESA